MATVIRTFTGKQKIEAYPELHKSILQVKQKERKLSIFTDCDRTLTNSRQEYDTDIQLLPGLMRDDMFREEVGVDYCVISRRPLKDLRRAFGFNPKIWLCDVGYYSAELWDGKTEYSLLPELDLTEFKDRLNAEGFKVEYNGNTLSTIETDPESEHGIKAYEALQNVENEINKRARFPRVQIRPTSGTALVLSEKKTRVPDELREEIKKMSGVEITNDLAGLMQIRYCHKRGTQLLSDLETILGNNLSDDWTFTPHYGSWELTPAVDKGMAFQRICSYRYGPDQQLMTLYGGDSLVDDYPAMEKAEFGLGICTDEKNMEMRIEKQKMHPEDYKGIYCWMVGPEPWLMFQRLVYEALRST